MNRCCRVAAAALLVLSLSLRTGDLAAAEPAPVHGSLDAFAAPGLALAWAVLRSSNEATTEVVVRVETDPKTYRALKVIGVDPFTKSAQPIAATVPIHGTATIRLPRARFAELPRTEWRLYASPTPGASETPALVIYYDGIPDTTPEFNDEAGLQASLAQRLERARSGSKAK